MRGFTDVACLLRLLGLAEEDVERDACMGLSGDKWTETDMAAAGGSSLSRSICPLRDGGLIVNSNLLY
jgi:hypothetical protein